MFIQRFDILLTQKFFMLMPRFFKSQCIKFCVSAILLLALLVPVIAQNVYVPNRYKQDEYAIHFGFCLGLNFMDFSTTPAYSNAQNDTLIADVSTPSPGFHIQIISNYRLGDYFDLRFLPGIAFGQRNLNFYDRRTNVLVSNKNQLESNFLEFPLLLKYKAKRLNNIRPYLISGANCRYDLAHNFNEDRQIYIGLKRLDLYYEIGTGIDFYLEFFKLSVELKFSYGLNNMLSRKDNISGNNEKYQNAIQRLSSTMTLLSFHFE